MKRTMLIGLALTVVFLLTSLPAQARPDKRFDKGTKMCRVLSDGILDWESEGWGAGGRKFREACQSCHSQAAGKAPFLHAETHLPKSWNRIFYEKRVKCAEDGTWDKLLSKEELLFVNDYLYRNGNWTYDPYDADTCG